MDFLYEELMMDKNKYQKSDIRIMEAYNYG